LLSSITTLIYKISKYTLSNTHAIIFYIYFKGRPAHPLTVDITKDEKAVSEV